MKQYTYPLLDQQAWRKTLPSGLPIVVAPTPGFTKKVAYLVTDYGAIHTRFSVEGEETVSPAGVAHYLEHKLFDMPGRDITGEFAALGAVPNAFTGYDLTAYYFSCTSHFNENLRLLLEFVTTPYFTEGSVAKEQGIIGQEIDMNVDNPDTRIFENLMEAMYESHPIRVPILGTSQSIAQITPAVLTQCHSAFYRPENMFLCVVGDVDPAQVAAIAEEFFPAKELPEVTAQRVWQEKMTCLKSYVEEQMEVAMPMFQIGFKCQPAENGEPAIRQETVGDLAAEALFGESSRLYLKLYEQGLIDGSFGGGFETVDSMAMLSCGGDSKDPDAVLQAILEQARKLLEEGLAEEDFQRMKRSALGRRLRDMDSFDSTAFRLCAYHFSGFDYFRFPEVYRAVEKEELTEFIRQAVTPERAALSVIVPIKEDAK